MASRQMVQGDLLSPISAEKPGGAVLRYEPEWAEIIEVRREDKSEDTGDYEKEGGFKKADWPLVQELATNALKEKSKDLQIAIWLTEANIHLHGFPGLRDSLNFIHELITQFWDTLHPQIEDGDLDYRSGRLEWLDEKLAEAVQLIALTDREDKDKGKDYSCLDYTDSRHVGSQKDCVQPNGDPDQKKLQTYTERVKAGRVSVEKWEEAVEKTRRAQYEKLYQVIEETIDEFLSLGKLIDQKFGKAAPPRSRGKEALEACRDLLKPILAKKRREEPDPSDAEAGDGEGEEAQAAATRFWTPSWSSDSNVIMDSSWQEAEKLVRSGRVDEGLGEMAFLAAAETSGRARFQRKLFLAEVCLAVERIPLAREILEELNEQIEKFHLEEWESSELVGRVWGQLYKCYRQNESANQDQAFQLYQRLCRLDPWQAFNCE